jgi:hypothetical protein
MLTRTKPLPKHLKTQPEPEQLDLFGWRPIPESASGNTLSATVCHQIATVACTLYGLGAEHNSHVRNLIVHRCSTEPFSSVWHDYLTGFASTMSFSPTPMQETFWRSDRAALASDWTCVQSDLNQVWSAITTAEGRCNERPRQQREWRRETQAAE